MRKTKYLLSPEYRVIAFAYAEPESKWWEGFIERNAGSFVCQIPTGMGFFPIDCVIPLEVIDRFHPTNGS